MKESYYFAYGSNMNLDQMAYRCPAASVVENVRLDGYRPVSYTHLNSVGRFVSLFALFLLILHGIRNTIGCKSETKIYQNKMRESVGEKRRE